MLWLVEPLLGGALSSEDKIAMQDMAAANVVILKSQAPFWFDSLSMIIMALITVVVGPVVHAWAKKRFATPSEK